jgi:GntR family transcriptional regulator
MVGRQLLSTRPLYLQVRDALVERISSGEWKPGEVIANEGDLARTFGVSAGTMRKALDLMEAERLLTRRQGRGTFVNDHASDELVRRFDSLRTAAGQYILTDVESAPIREDVANELESRRLSLQPSQRVYRIRRVHLHKGHPFVVHEAAVPADLFPGLADNDHAPHQIVILAQQHGVLLGKAQERISIGAAQGAVAATLDLAPGSPILIMDRVVHALDGGLSNGA